MGLKKTSEMTHLSGRFCFHILESMAQNKKSSKFPFKLKQYSQKHLKAKIVAIQKFFFFENDTLSTKFLVQFTLVAGKNHFILPEIAVL